LTSKLPSIILYIEIDEIVLYYIVNLYICIYSHAACIYDKDIILYNIIYICYIYMLYIFVYYLHTDLLLLPTTF
jgi:hypothetical protein